MERTLKVFWQSACIRVNVMSIGILLLVSTNLIPTSAPSQSVDCRVEGVIALPHIVAHQRRQNWSILKGKGLHQAIRHLKDSHGVKFILFWKLASFQHHLLHWKANTSFNHKITNTRGHRITPILPADWNVLPSVDGQPVVHLLLNSGVPHPTMLRLNRSNHLHFLDVEVVRNPTSHVFLVDLWYRAIKNKKPTPTDHGRLSVILSFRPPLHIWSSLV